MNELAVIDPVEQMEALLLPNSTVDMASATHHFLSGMYIRHMSAPAGMLLLGHRHKTTHPNLLLKGRMRLWMNGIVQDIEAPHIFESLAGSRKVAVTLEDVEFATFHITIETNVETLEDELFEKSNTWLEFHKRKELCQP